LKEKSSHERLGLSIDWDCTGDFRHHHHETFAGFSALAPLLLMYLLYGCSYAALNLAFKQIDLSLGYAVWCGLGTLLITLVSWGLFTESISLPRCFPWD
jgi:multidrug transporter EmrE-like cation transporter